MEQVAPILPFINIGIPVLNECRTLRATINDVLSQDYPRDRFQVVVADGGSTDGTVEIVESLISEGWPVVLKRNGRKVSASGRNLCLLERTADIFVFLDGHCHIPSRSWLYDIADLLEKKGADCLARPQPLDHPNNSNFQKAIAFCRQSRSGHISNSLIYASHEGFVSPVSHGAAYTRAVVDAIGLYDERFDACEDVEFNFRVEAAGFQTFMSPRLTVCYRPRSSPVALFHQVFRYGRGRARLICKHPNAATSDTALAPLPAACACALILLATFVKPIFFIAAGLAAAYCAWFTGTALFSRPRAPLAGLIYVPLVYFIIHVGFSIGFAMGLLIESCRGERPLANIWPNNVRRHTRARGLG